MIYLLFLVLKLYRFTLAGPVALLSFLFAKHKQPVHHRNFYFLSASYMAVSLVDGTAPTGITGIISIIILFYLAPMPFNNAIPVFTVLFMAAYATSWSMILYMIIPFSILFQNRKGGIFSDLAATAGIVSVMAAGVIHNHFALEPSFLKDVAVFVTLLFLAGKRFSKFFDLIYFSLIMILYFIITISVTETEFKLVVHLFLFRVLTETYIENKNNTSMEKIRGARKGLLGTHQTG